MFSFVDHAIVVYTFMFSFVDHAIVVYTFMLSFVDHAIVVYTFMFSFFFVIVCVIFEWIRIFAGFLSFVYICIAVGDPVINRGGFESH